MISKSTGTATKTSTAAAKPRLSSQAMPRIAKPRIASRMAVESNDKGASQKVVKAMTPVPVEIKSQGASKQSKLIEMLRSDAGGTITQLMELTGWQAHTVRGTISAALRKRLGLNVQCATSLASGAKVYRIVAKDAA